MGRQMISIRDRILQLRNGQADHYSLKRIERIDLKRLAKIAADDVESFFNQNPTMRNRYEERFLCSALCQGAAIHFAWPELEYGVKDFDVWSFFSIALRETGRGMFKRRATRKILEDQRFGEYPVGTGGRRVDLFWRSIAGNQANPVTAIQDWLRGRTKSARFLSRKAVVLIDPPRYRGQTVWLFAPPPRIRIDRKKRLPDGFR